ncbi:HflK protein [Imhoffiella purpurea]|uniref:HflK protein n=1 Tax=Imhoffiella purpurea TaxID=1249627 RepID=W9VUZ9_9GAMM|nr:HflK protein [Imhoffiella purpurea]
MQVRAALQYRVPYGVRMQVREADIERMMAHVAELALTERISSRRLPDLLDQDLDDLAAGAADRVRIELRDLGLDPVVVGLQILSIQPPPRVVDAYRDVFDALQDKQTLELGAEARRAAALADAHAEGVATDATARAEAIEKRLAAEGDAAHFAALTQVYRSHPEVVRFNRYLDVVTERLAGREIIVTDAALDPGDRRLWGQGLIGIEAPDPAARRRTRP